MAKKKTNNAASFIHRQTGIIITDQDYEKLYVTHQLLFDPSNEMPTHCLKSDYNPDAELDIHESLQGIPEGDVSDQYAE